MSYLNLTTLELRRIRGDLIQVFKIVHGLDNLKFDDFFKLSNYSGTRGHSFKLSKQYSRLDVRKFSFSQRVVDEWNGLPDTLVCAVSVNAFKNGLDKYFKDCGRI